MIIALASPAVASSIDEGLEKVRHFLSEAASRDADIVCFPEAYVPGLRGVEIEVPPFDASQQERVLRAVSQWCSSFSIATVLGTERITPAGRQIAAYVFGADGELLGYQTKNQIAPSEDPFYLPGTTRRIFEVNGVRFGVAICHEGWRYPETVRWAAVRGAKVVFHPQHTGSDRTGPRLTQFGSPEAPYYEKAMVLRSIENTIYFASVNYGLRYQEAATPHIYPAGECQAWLPYGGEGLLVEAIDPEAATGLIASRFAPERYGEAAVEGTEELRNQSGANMNA